MNTRYFFTDKAPKPIGPYSQAVEAGPFIYISGQIPLHYESGEVVGDDIATQAKTVLTNLKAVLNVAGLDFTNLVKTTVFLTDLTNFAQFNQIYQQELGNTAPARSVVEVSALPRGVLVEIEAVAYK
ncbi:MAG: Rid family detoxifying hydrolase [Chitinispirillales bacterium]|jgi:2-iminobutanoate/2-iminopropanoate deaminase|nr:Rid family detoxifying hydrolase [Chitinispirillales bacterium]